MSFECFFRKISTYFLIYMLLTLVFNLIVSFEDGLKLVKLRGEAMQVICGSWFSFLSDLHSYTTNVFGK